MALVRSDRWDRGRPRPQIETETEAETEADEGARGPMGNLGKTAGNRKWALMSADNQAALSRIDPIESVRIGDRWDRGRPRPQIVRRRTRASAVPGAISEKRRETADGR